MRFAGGFGGATTPSHMCSNVVRPDMGKKKIQARLDPETKEQLDKYATDVDISKSEAVRRAVRQKLADEDYPVPTADGGISQSEYEDLKQAEEATQRLTVGSIVAGLIFIGTVTVANVPSWAVILLGSLLIAALLGSLVYEQGGRR
jgi:predicted transcriptional regulator